MGRTSSRKGPGGRPPRPRRPTVAEVQRLRLVLRQRGLVVSYALAARALARLASPPSHPE